MKGRKNPSPRPLTPPNTLGFFLYTRTTLKMLVEHQNRVFSCSGFICVNERTKCAKNPNINRVKFHHDLVLTLFVLGGAESTPWPEKCVFRPVVDEKSEIKGQKNPSPRPLTPPNTLGFFLYTRTTLKLLVEHQNRVFSCSVFICVNERTKCAKNPNINRVKFHHDLVLTLFVLGGGGGIHPMA